MIPLLLALALAVSPPPEISTLQTAEAVLALPALHAPGTHVVHFWATWCGPCVEELPGFVERARALAAQGVDFTFLSLDPAEELQRTVLPTLTRAGAFFAGAHHHRVSEAIDPEAITRKLDRSWQGGLPATFIYKDGKQVGVFRGAREAHALDHLGKPKSSR